jgi:hypothetical protein
LRDYLPETFNLPITAAGIEESDNIDGMRNAFIDAFMKQLSEQKLVR